MFNWNIGECKLLKERKNKRFTKFACENIVSQEDKIAFIDHRKNGAMTAALNLIKKYKEDIESGVIKSNPTFTGKKPKTVSFKAWLAKNDTSIPYGLCDRDYHYGQFRGFGYNADCFIQDLDNDGKSSEEFIDNAFHNVLLNCASDEEKYFREHDEYEIAKRKIRDHKYVGLIVNLSMYNGEDIMYRPRRKKNESDEEWCERMDNMPPLTLDELNEILEKADELREYILEFSKTVLLNDGMPVEEGY